MGLVLYRHNQRRRKRRSPLVDSILDSRLCYVFLLYVSECVWIRKLSSVVVTKSVPLDQDLFGVTSEVESERERRRGRRGTSKAR